MPAPAARRNDFVLSLVNHRGTNTLDTHAFREFHQANQQMLAVLDRVVALVWDVKTIWLIRFDVIDNHMRNVAQVCVLFFLVISWIERNRGDFKRISHLHRLHVQLIVERRSNRIHNAVEVVTPTNLQQFSQDFNEVLPMKYAIAIRRQ